MRFLCAAGCGKKSDPIPSGDEGELDATTGTWFCSDACRVSKADPFDFSVDDHKKAKTTKRRLPHFSFSIGEGEFGVGEEPNIDDEGQECVFLGNASMLLTCDDEEALELARKLLAKLGTGIVQVRLRGELQVPIRGFASMRGRCQRCLGKRELDKKTGLCETCRA